MPGTFSTPPRVSDPDMHHGTCVTHVPWCMPVSLTTGFLWSRPRGDRSRHFRRMRSSQFYVSGKRPLVVDGRGDARNHVINGHSINVEWGFLSQFPTFRYFHNFSALSKHTLSHWISRLYLKGVATAQLRGHMSNMWFKESNRYFCKIEIFAYVEINGQSFSNTQPFFQNIQVSAQ